MEEISEVELQHRIDELLARAEGGEAFTITVAGRRCARLGPLERGHWAKGSALQRVWQTVASETLNGDLKSFP